MTPHELAIHIAPHLSSAASSAAGGRWRVTGLQEDHGARLTLDGGPHDGASLWLTINRHDGRAEVGGTFPMLDSGRYYSPKKEEYARIGFDAQRDARAIARDIERRCLTVYLGAYAKACAYRDREKVSRAHARQAGYALAVAGRCDARPQGTDGQVVLFPTVAGAYKVTVHPSDDSPPTVSMELEKLTAAQAASVLSMLALSEEARRAG